MTVEERRELPLTGRRKVLAAAGATMLAAQVIAAMALAAPTTGAGDARAGVFAALWLVSVSWSVIAVLLLVRQADLPDVFTASMLVTVSAYAAYALTAALAVRGTRDDINVVDAMFFGITTGALTAILVWGIAMGLARMLHLPRT